MPARLTRKRLTLGAAMLLVSALALGAEVRCSEADAQRVSLASLQAQIDGLQTQLDAIDAPPRVVDGDGNDIGQLVYWCCGQAFVYLEEIGAQLELYPESGIGDSLLHNVVAFTDVNCTGQPYVERGLRNQITGSAGDQRFFVSIPGAISQDAFVRSSFANGTCQTFNPVLRSNLLAAEEVTAEMPFTFPLSLPIEIQPAM